MTGTTAGPWIAGLQDDLGVAGLAFHEPAGVAEAAAVLDRIARYCAYTCERASACIEEECAAWQLEQAAAGYLVSHWVAGEG